MNKLYPVQRIIGKKNISGRVHYLIKWKGFEEDQATWEMYAHLKHLRPLIMEFNARLKIDQWRQRAKRKAEYCASRQINMQNEKEERENDQIKVHHINSDPNRKPQGNRIDVSSNKNMSILSILESQLADEEENRGQEMQHQSKTVFKQEETGQELVEFGQDMDDCLTQISQEEESVASEYQKKKVVTQKKLKPVSMNLPNNRLMRSRVEKSMRDLSSYSSEIDGSQSEEVKEKPKTQAKNNSKGRVGVRMSVVKRKDKKGMEYFVEDKSGKLKRYSGKEVIEHYPEDFLTFAEAIISKYMP